MSINLIATDTSSEIEFQIFPARSLDSAKQYGIALLSFSTYNSISNVTNGIRDAIYPIHPVTQVLTRLSFPEGTYSYEDLVDCVIEKLKQYARAHSLKEDILLRLNTITSRFEFKAGFGIDFSKSDSLGELFGFDQPLIKPDTLYVATHAANIPGHATINVETSILASTSTYLNGKESQIICSIVHDQPLGFKILYSPPELIYKELNTDQLSSISFRVVDEKGRLLNFRDELITINLIIKEL